jgi:hypothetical protein
MKTRIPACGLPLLFLFAAVAARAGSFSADLVETKDGRPQTHAFHFVDGSYCFEATERGRELLIVVDASKGVTRIVAPQEKAYRELKTTDMHGAVLNPFVSCTFAYPNSALRIEGKESIDGLPCTKRVLAVNGNDFFVSWTADEFGLPIKIEDRLTQRTFELRNLERGPQDAALFAVPTGFELKGDPETEPPEWAADLAKAPRLTPPFQKTLAAGEVVRIVLKAGFTINLQVTNPSSDDSTGVGVPFKDGRPLFDPKGETFTLAAAGEVTTGCTRSPAQADDYVFHVKAGQLALKATYAPSTNDRGSAGATPPPALDAEARFPEARVSARVADRLQIAWEGPMGQGDFIAIARPDQPVSASVGRVAVREGNPAKLWAPSDAGTYELRYVTGGRPAKVLATATLTVKRADASMDAPTSVPVAAPFEATWEGPQADGDFVSIAAMDAPPGAALFRVPVKNGQPAKLRAPSEPGEYEIRYVLGRGSKVLALTSTTVTPVTATVAPPNDVKAATEFTFEWTGPAYEEDFLCVVAPNAAPASPSPIAVRASLGNPAKLRAPKTPGTYEVRYILGRGRKVLAQAPLTVTAP